MTNLLEVWRVLRKPERLNHIRQTIFEKNTNFETKISSFETDLNKMLAFFGDQSSPCVDYNLMKRELDDLKTDRDSYKLNLNEQSAKIHAKQSRNNNFCTNFYKRLKRIVLYICVLLLVVYFFVIYSQIRLPFFCFDFSNNYPLFNVLNLNDDDTLAPS